jgi:hypothetical protein
MPGISRDLFMASRQLEPRRRCFGQHTGVQKNKKPGSPPSFSVKFFESIGPVYESMTGNKLQYSAPCCNYWHFLRTEPEIQAVEEWERQQGTRIFLRDCLDCSIALGVNRESPEAQERTALGQLEYNAKINADDTAVDALVGHFADAISSLPFYGQAKNIVGVPARPGKVTRDLPTELAARLATRLGLNDLTGAFHYGGTREQLKALPLAERWAAWEGAKLSLTDEGKRALTGNPVILIDDKYQSGVSANFVAMILQQHGATAVYGLYAVKTLRDDDNS